MYKAKFRVFHHGCWGSGLTKKFPDLIMYISTFHQTDEEHIQDAVYVSGDNKKFDEVIDYLRSHKIVYNVKILDRAEDYLFLQIYTSWKNILANTLARNNCFLLEPIRLHNGYEWWSIGSASKENLQAVYNDQQNVGDVKLLYIKEATFEGPDLTAKQQSIVKMAYDNGYYEIPHRTSLDELAKKANLGKTTFLEHMRKAEAKIIKNFVEK